ncbi:uncharacterized protein LOC112265253 isoform X3 [Oncorhynchus tshawytscha]|uniref:uncharacterized protein LOC112265253 isoform X3 n=1 Tax=Oncorhynchus tshawytscha TaxID=74940 RepID=UPI000D0A3810|nr:uncharacterized protein LOC112265253 isoform X3 [Oncorhynchus tshawytscha]
MSKSHKRLRRVRLKAWTLQASVGEQVPQTDDHGGPRLPVLVDCTKKSPLKNFVPKPPQGPRLSNQAMMAKVEKNAREAIEPRRAREAIEPRRAREANAEAKKTSRQVIGALALPPPLLSPTTSYSVLPAIKKGTKVTKVETTEPPDPLTPEDEVRMNSSPSVDDPLTPETPETDVTSDATSLADPPREMTPENVEEAFSLEDFLKSHPQWKLIRKFLKQKNVTIKDLEDMSYVVLLPAMALLRSYSPESSHSSCRGSGVLKIVSEMFHWRSSEPKGRLWGGQPPTSNSETDKELQGIADMAVSNILRNAQDDFFSSGVNDLEMTNPNITLTKERLSSIFSELFRDACESAQEAARRIHHMRSGRGNNSRNGSRPGSSQGSSRSNMPELPLNLCQLAECVDAQPLYLEHPSVSCSNRSGLHPIPEQGWMEEHIGSALGQLSTIEADMGELENFTRPLPLENGDDSSSNMLSGPSTASYPSTCLSSPDVTSEGRAHYTIMALETLQEGEDNSWSRSGSSQRSRRFNLCHQAEELERVYLQRDTLHSRVSVGELGSVRWAKGRDVHKALSEGSLPVFALLRERPGEIWPTSTWDMAHNQPPSTPTSSKEDLWDSDSTWSHGVGEEEGAEPRVRLAAMSEGGSSQILTSQTSTSLSNHDKRALEAICQVLTAWMEQMLNRTCNNIYSASVIIQKEEEDEVVASVMTFLHSEPSTSTKAAQAAPAKTLAVNPCLDEDEVVPSTSMIEGSLTTTQAAWAASAQILEEEVGGADVSEVSIGSLTPTEARQDLLEKIPSLLPGEILIEEDIPLLSTPRDTVMSPQTLKLILQGIMRRLEASESPRARRANDPFRLMKDLFLEVQHALKYADISVLFSLEESIQFRGEDAMKAIVKAAAKRLSLRSDSNRAQLRAVRYGGEGAIYCMADTIANVIDVHAQDWSSDRHFGASRSRGRGRSRSSSSSSKSDITLTEELLAQGESLEEDQEDMAAIDDNKKCDSASLEKASSSSLSIDLVDSTSTQKTGKDEAVKEGVGKSGDWKRGCKKTLKKNKMAPFGTDDTVADEPEKKQCLLLRITAALANLFCFPCKKRSGKKFKP